MFTDLCVNLPQQIKILYSVSLSHYFDHNMTFYFEIKFKKKIVQDTEE